MLRNRLYFICLLLFFTFPLFGNDNVGKDFHITFEDAISGSLIDSDQYKDGLFVIHFWSSTCPPCQNITSSVVQMYQNLKDKDVGLIGINRGRSIDDLKTYCTSHEMTWPQMHEISNFSLIDWTVTSIPRFFLIHKSVIVEESSSLSVIENEIKKRFGDKL